MSGAPGHADSQLPPGRCITCGYDLAGLNDPAVCPECGYDPLEPAGDPDVLVHLTTSRTSLEAEVIAQALRQEGIPAEAFTTAGTALQWEIASMQPMRVQVRRRDLRRARAALREIRAGAADIDWSQVDTGDPTPVTEEERVEEARQSAVPNGPAVRGARRSVRWWLAIGGVLVLLVVLGRLGLFS